MSGKKSSERADADRDLMLFFDDELDAEQRTNVQVRVMRDRGAQRKLAAMKLVGDILRDQAAQRGAAADGVADAVMARIAAETARQPAAPSEGSKEGKVVALEAERRRRQAAEEGAAKRIYTLAAVAVAVAAGVMIWGKMEAGPPTSIAPVVTHSERVAEPAPSASPAAPDAPAPEREPEMGVEVAAVDFGAGHGSVFFVPGDASGAVTTVVWLADDAAGGEQ